MGAEFTTGAGFSAVQLGLFIRGFIAALATLWVAWVMYKQFQLFGQGRMPVGEWGGNTIKLVILLVFILIVVGA